MQGTGEARVVEAHAEVELEVALGDLDVFGDVRSDCHGRSRRGVLTDEARGRSGGRGCRGRGEDWCGASRSA